MTACQFQTARDLANRDCKHPTGRETKRIKKTETGVKSKRCGCPGSPTNHRPSIQVFLEPFNCLSGGVELRASLAFFPRRKRREREKKRVGERERDADGTPAMADLLPDDVGERLSQAAVVFFWVFTRTKQRKPSVKSL